MADDNALRVLFDFIDSGLNLLYASYESGCQECQKEDLLTIAEEILKFSVLIDTIHHEGSALVNSMQEVVLLLETEVNVPDITTFESLFKLHNYNKHKLLTAHMH